MAKADAEKAPKKGPSIVIQLAMLLLLTGAAAGTGWLTGSILTGEKPAVGTGKQIGEEEGYDTLPGSDMVAEALHVFRLEPISTNLADPVDIWARMELALVFTDVPDPLVAEAIHQDFLAYLRTVKARQIQGASGFQHMKTDLEERARIRSDGRVDKVLVRTLLFE
ncbi:MAG: flagellar basal body-associated FliL family protein [Rhizobiaceae bacterium]|nr:flagellar basal body-associated FliL family protein [Rhizobiaceae bacterium]MCC0044680.1 flagellar basal body-associated FliL family protein [Brucellaceae bacterium]